MELREAFTGRWIILMVAVPAITALMAAFFFLSAAEDEFEASGVVSVREFSAIDEPANIRSVIDDFDSALGGRQVADTVTAVEGLDTASARIEVVVLGGGGDVGVSYVAATAKAALEALDGGVREGLTIVSEVERRRVDRQLIAAETVSRESIERLLEIEARAGSANLNEEIARRSADILALRNQIASAGQGATQSALAAILAEKQDELAAIEAQLLPWTEIKSRLDRAVTSSAEVSLRLQQIATSQEALRSDEILQSVQIDELSKVPGLVRVAVGAAIATALVILVVVRVPAFRSESPRPARTRRRSPA